MFSSHPRCQELRSVHCKPLSAGILMLTQRRATSSSPLSFRRFRTNHRSQCLRECPEEPITQARVEANTQYGCWVPWSVACGRLALLSEARSARSQGGCLAQLAEGLILALRAARRHSFVEMSRVSGTQRRAPQSRPRHSISVPLGLCPVLGPEQASTPAPLPGS